MAVDLLSQTSSDPVSLIAVGTVTGMLVAMFGLMVKVLLRSSTDTREDSDKRQIAADQLLEDLRVERDYWRDNYMRAIGRERNADGYKGD